MVLPFEVTCSACDLYFILLVLRKAPGGEQIYGIGPALGNILGYIKYCRFGDLQEAVFACLAARRNEVRLVRNATLPERLPQCVIPRNETLRLSSSGGPWRLRIYNNVFSRPSGNLIESGKPLFLVGDGARLSIERIFLEATFSQHQDASMGSPHVALLLGNENTGLTGVVTFSDDVKLNGYKKQLVLNKAIAKHLHPGILGLVWAKVIERGSVCSRKSQFSIERIQAILVG